MPAASLSRPGTDEYAPFYQGYISRVPDGDVVTLLAGQIVETTALLRSISAERSLHRYAPGKWSIRDVVQHMSDCERIMTYRALRIARGDETPLAGFDEAQFAAAAGADAREWLDLIGELEAIRKATVGFARALDAGAAVRRGTANGFVVSARALTFIIAGHERHHVAILRERYLQP